MARQVPLRRRPANCLIGQHKPELAKKIASAACFFEI
jgi:hypothetical protein